MFTCKKLNKIQPKSSTLGQDQPSLGQSSPPGASRQLRMANIGYIGEKELQASDSDEEEEDQIYEPKDEEEVLFPSYLSPADNVALQRRGVFVASRTNALSGKRRQRMARKVKRIIESTAYSIITYSKQKKA